MPSVALAAHYYTNCTILNDRGQAVRKLPGVRCIFFGNGDLISSNADVTTYFDHRMAVRWQIKLSNHHYLELSRDGKSFYLLGSSVHPYVAQGKTVQLRYDVLYKLDVATGKIQSTWDSFPHYSELARLLALPDPLSNQAYFNILTATDVHPGLDVKPTQEFTHFNSIREVPANKLGFFKPGQIVVNANYLGYVIVFDHELKQPLYSIELAKHEVTHSANVTAEGNLIYFQNTHANEAVPKYSSLVEYQPTTKKNVWTFPGVESLRPFYSDTFGYVEEVGAGRIIFSTPTHAWEIDRKGKVYWHLDNSLIEQHWDLMPIKKTDLSEFLHHNQS